MASISSSHLVYAVLRVERMTLQQREQLAEGVRAQQRNLFLSVLVLQRYGATLEQLEVMLNLLLVSYEAMKRSGKNWPLVSQEVHSRCLAQVCERLRFKEGLKLQLQARAASDGVGEHPPVPISRATPTPREISEQRGRYDDQPAVEGPDGCSECFFRSGRIARSP